MREGGRGRGGIAVRVRKSCGDNMAERRFWHTGRVEPKAAGVEVAT